MQIIFFKASKGKWDDKLISWFTGSPYSHCEIHHRGHRYGVRPDLGRVAVIPRHEPDKEYWDSIEMGVSEERLNKFIAATLHKKYDWKSIILTHLFRLKLHNKNKYICSEWVAELLEWDKPYLYTPGDVFNKLLNEKDIKITRS